ncbi:RNA 2',3'-cyclic phosphodiesterase [Desulfosporosinus sp. FKB]|uniref:RNA 2',3'-cyclic phosphodiesterase n=1 Tax=Desulfosporosinus sp. FKB TaxID=1969835 RepID=UPI000B4A48E1|nr:RNA 2',3'-cyclic phosphodiesterase [Desulfosporosinus sp. FKB]
MRLFIGIDIPAELKHFLLSFQSELRGLGVNGSWKSADNFHITLEFLGELDPEVVPIIIESMSLAAENRKPFKIDIGGLGVFPSYKRPHTLWTGVGGNLTELNQLREGIHALLVNKSFTLESKKFKPHITLASRPNLKQIDLSSLMIKKLVEFTVEEVTLFESIVLQGKRTYKSLNHARLQ